MKKRTKKEKTQRWKWYAEYQTSFVCVLLFNTLYSYDLNSIWWRHQTKQTIFHGRRVLILIHISLLDWTCIANCGKYLLPVRKSTASIDCFIPFKCVFCMATRKKLHLMHKIYAKRLHYDLIMLIDAYVKCISFSIPFCSIHLGSGLVW